MLNTSVELPLWFALGLAVGCIYAVVMSVLMPSVRWFFRRRLNRAIEKLNQRLQIQIRPFQRTKRQVLIDRLMAGGSAMREDEKPKQSTISQSLSLLSSRGVLVEEADRFHYNDESRPLISYYANSIRHWVSKE